jgi:hypothetical protein
MIRPVTSPRAPFAYLAVVVALALPCGCKKKVNDAQCGDLLDRYSALLVKEKLKDATPEQVKAAQAHEREEAQRDDDFKNCATELSMDDYGCAMKAETSQALEKCLE